MQENNIDTLKTDFVQDTVAGVALRYVTAEDLTAFIDKTREETQYVIEYSKRLSQIILSTDNEVEGGVSMAAIVELLEEIEKQMLELEQPELAMLRMRRSMTVVSATLGMPIPPRFVEIDSVSQTAISMLAHISNKQKEKELAQKIAKMQADNAPVEEKQGLPESAQQEVGESALLTAAIEVVEQVLES